MKRITVRRLIVLACVVLLISVGSALAENSIVQQTAQPELFAPAVYNTSACTTVVGPGQSIQAAISNAQSGHVICVRAGTYNEQLQIKPAQAGITVQAYQGERPIIDGQGRLPAVTANSKYQGLIHITGNNVTVDGLEVRNSAIRGIAVAQPSTGSQPLANVTVRNMIVRGSQDSGININGSSTHLPRNILIENNIVFGNLLKNASNHVGGSGLAFVEVENSTARGNVIFNNLGEGLVADRWTKNLTFEDNVSYDNKHSNIYLVNTINPLVQRNLVFCSDDRNYWRGASNNLKPGPGLQIRDEDFEGQTVKPPPSSGQVIINNIVVGCGANFGVSSQINNGGLNNALVANNSFINARSETGADANNIEIHGEASLRNTRFVNNLILQSVPGTITRIQYATGTPDLSSFSLANNLYSSNPGNGWPANESNRKIADPMLSNPAMPVKGSVPNAAGYGLRSGSPAINAGAGVSQVTNDYFRENRSGALDIGADEAGGGGGTGPTTGRIVVTKSTTPDRSTQAFSFTASYVQGGFQLRDGESHDSGQLAAGTHSVALTPMNGWTSSASCSDGSSPGSIALAAGETVTCTFDSRQEGTGGGGTLDATVYLTTFTPGTVGGVAFEAGDILAYSGDNNTWSIYFDGSDVGIVKPINEFEMMPDGSLLLALNGKVKLNGPGGAFTLLMQDIARFVPTGTGANTAGAFELFFDGSDVGLSKSSEKIDALARKADGTLLISTYGTASVANGGTTIKAQDEDLLAFKPTSTGANTAGAWSLALDGSSVPGLGSEDITAAWHDNATGVIYLAAVNNFSVNGAGGTNQSILAVTPSKAASVYWNAAGAGFPGSIDGLHIVP